MSDYAHPAEWYDRIYAHIGKDYAGEADAVDGAIRARNPTASSLLDVGCGTGLHLARFAELYADTAGVDLDPDFVERARRRGLRADRADMRDFALARTFDAVTCLFSAIGHVGDTDGLAAAVCCMADHLAPGGVLVIEPWFTPDAWIDGTYGVEVAEAPDSTLVRASHSSSDGDVSVLDFAWTELTPAGIRTLREELRLTRFTHDQYADAFAAVDLTASFDERGLPAGRGLWVAQAP